MKIKRSLEIKFIAQYTLRTMVTSATKRSPSINVPLGNLNEKKMKKHPHNSIDLLIKMKMNMTLEAKSSKSINILT